MNKYFIYCRKSSEDDDRQILSIEAQLAEMNEIIVSNGLQVVETFEESMSAKSPGREIFNDMIRRIACGEANAILCWKLDRLARNFDDGGKIIGLLQREAIKEIRTFEKTYLPTDNVLMIALEFGIANQYVRDLSSNIRRGIRQKIRRGVYSGKAPLGYVNDPKLRTIEPHPENFQKLKRIFHLFATGKYTLAAIEREAKTQKLIGERGRKPLRINTISKLFQNPFYYGVFLHKGEMHQGVHVPMITKRMFDDVQKARIMVSKPRKHRGDKGLMFLNFATCDSCGGAVTGERHIKKSGLQFRYYRCTHKVKGRTCEERNFMRQENFAEEIKRNTELVTLPDEWKERFLAKIETWETEACGVRQQQIDRLKSELAALKSRLDRVNNAFVDGSLELQEFKEIKNPLIQQKTDLEQRLIALEKAKTSRLEPLKNWVLLANKAVKWVSSDNWLEMKSFLTNVGSNRLLHAQTLSVKFKKHWFLLAETTVAVRSTNDFFTTNSLWWRWGELDPRAKDSFQWIYKV